MHRVNPWGIYAPGIHAIGQSTKIILIMAFTRKKTEIVIFASVYVILIRNVKELNVDGITAAGGRTENVKNVKNIP